MSELETRLKELKETCHSMSVYAGMNKELWTKHVETIDATLHVLDLARCWTEELTMKIKRFERGD